MLFAKYNIIYMVAHEDKYIVSRFVPTGLAGHIVVDGTAVDFQALESDVVNTTLFVVTIDDGDVGRLAFTTV